jgi:sugar/nucleoside kinase (ribokinase family)
MRFDYVSVGHVTIDVLERDGSRVRVPGGGAFYSALQASRLGLRTLILTRGAPGELEELLAPFTPELSLHLIPSQACTSFATSGQGSQRVQRLLSWAGPIEHAPAFRCSILHLAPVARETPPSLVRSLPGRCEFLALTPQGLIRRWSPDTGAISPSALERDALPPRYDAAVISAQERPSCATLLAHPPAGSVLAVTAGSAPTTLHVAGGRPERVPSCPVKHPVDDLGAGDVFASAFFIGLYRGFSPARAASFASAAAAVRIAGSGPSAVGTAATIEGLWKPPPR